MVSNANPVTHQRSLLSLSTDALALAVSTVLRLVDAPVAMTEKTTQAADTPVSTPLSDTLPEISLDQVSWHDTVSDCWIVVYDRVYDVTQFLFEHPGGEEIILEYAGRDATFAFRGVGHTVHAWRALDKYLVGQLPPNERIFKSGSSTIFENAALATNLPLSAGG